MLYKLEAFLHTGTIEVRSGVAVIYVNGGFDTRKQGKTAKKDAKIGLSEVKFNLDSPFFTVFLCRRDRCAGKVVTLAVTDFAIIKMCEGKLKGAKHHLIPHAKGIMGFLIKIHSIGTSHTPRRGDGIYKVLHIHMETAKFIFDHALSPI
ncbi:MAG: hypothetical protein LUD44_06885 [Firmicutes bacterium]|nr:hypothetical protein [Bacillota bacterium]